MKTSQRHHLKENDLATALRRAADITERHQRNIGLAIGVIVLLAVAIGGFFMWRSRTETQAREMLAQAMVVNDARVIAPAPAAPDATTPATPPVQQPGTYPTERAKLETALPKFVATADAYPSTDAGKTARYHAASTLVGLARFDEAIQQYDRVISGGGLLGEMARLGKAEAQLRARQFDPAIASLKEVSERTDSSLAKEQVLLELARAYKLAGKTEDARKTLNQIVEQHADSPSATEAKQELEKLTGP